MTIYSGSQSPKYWSGKDDDRPEECSALLRKGRRYFQALTINIDFRNWHQGYPEAPLKNNKDGYLYVYPYTESFIKNLTECIGFAKELDYTPILLKIKIMDYIAPNGVEHKWRAFLRFNPLKGNYILGEQGAVSLAVKSLSRLKDLGYSTDDLIVSINDEYTNSILDYPYQWKNAHIILKERLLETGVEAKIAINLDWALPYFKLKKFYKMRTLNADLSSLLQELDLVGWSLYRPYWGHGFKGVKRAQLANAMRLRRFMNRMKLESKPMAIFEFGVSNNWRPSSWDIGKRSLKDQKLAYLAWLSLLKEHKTPVTTIFSFWFGHFDPRHVIENELLEY
jgi:hypothetical protein